MNLRVSLTKAITHNSLKYNIRLDDTLLLLPPPKNCWQ